LAVIEGGASGGPARCDGVSGRAGRHLARGSFRRLDLAARRHQGPPARKRARLLQDRSRSRRCDASRARPPSDQDAQR
jgi:hypothetical protein